MNGTWLFDYVLKDGLNLGVPYAVANYPAGLSPATDGCRSIVGHIDKHGYVDLFATTSTVSTSGDQGADPNLLVRVTDRLDAITLPRGNYVVDDGHGHHHSGSFGRFDIIRAAKAGEVLRGVALAPERD